MISLNYRDSRPIYEQIRDGLRKLIVTGALGADEKLPSVRELAQQAGVKILARECIVTPDEMKINSKVPVFLEESSE